MLYYRPFTLTKKGDQIVSGEKASVIYPDVQKIFRDLYHLWIFLRIVSSNDPFLPTFSGWCVQEESKKNNIVEKTVLTYLPPINASVTNFSTMDKVFQTIQRCAEKAHMPYANLTLDVGAAMNAYKLLWNYPEKYKNIIIHLGDFHFLKEGVAMLGKLVSGSGFEDIIFQSGICSTGSLNGVIAGSQYNRCWSVHGILAESLERLLFERFIINHEVKSNQLKKMFKYKEITYDMLNTLSTLPEVLEIAIKFETFKDEVRAGKHGRTAQFWLVYYLDFMMNQHLLHSAIQTNDFSLRLCGLKGMMPFTFALDKQNYARYGSYYVHSLENLDITHPGCRELLEDKGISVQAQERYPCRTAIDQRGEQTINRDAKTSGGIKYFASDENSILKWTLNRAAQSKNTEALYTLAGVHHSDTIYKSTRPSEFLKSEKYVTSVIRVLTEEYINPFGDDLNKESLFNLSSGLQVDIVLAKRILDNINVGKKCYKDFIDNRLESENENIHNPIKRQNPSLFNVAKKTVTVKGKSKTDTVEVNRNVLNKLLAYSAKTGKTINFKETLSYPLSPVPLSLAHPDGTRRSTTKSALTDILIKYCD